MTPMTLSITLDERTYGTLKQRASAEQRDSAEVASGVVAEWVALGDELRAEFAWWEKAGDNDLLYFEKQLM